MGKLDKYREYILGIMNEYKNSNMIPRDVDDQLVIDRENDHYLFIRAGWHKNRRREYGLLFHVDIINDKFWIQHDGTETAVANQLVEMGVPKQDIVLAYHSPGKRPFTEFAVG